MFKQPTKHKIRNTYLEKKLFKRGLMIVISLLVIFSCLILYRLFDLQVIHHQQYTTQSKNNILSLIPINPRRGTIYDRNNHILAKEIPIYNLTITQNKVTNLKDTLTKIQKYVPLSANDIKYFYNSLYRYRKNQPIILKYNLSENESDLIYAHQLDLPGVNISPGLKRIYPYGLYTSHVVGYIGRINADDKQLLSNPDYQASTFTGRTGLEKYFETQLHGNVGYNQIETNAAGKIIRQHSFKPVKAGINLHTTLDIALQKAIINIMGNRVGSVVVMNPQTGEVLSMVSTPTFDPNLFINGLSANQYANISNNHHYPLVDRAIHGDFSPGSTIKPFYSYYALSQHWLNKYDTVLDPGWFKLPGTKHIFHDDLPGNYGELNVVKAIILSSDTFFYTLANTLGIERLNKALSYFHFGRSTGIQLPNENKGLIPTPSWKKAIIGTKWFPGDTINAGIGQGYVLMTPLQLAQGTSMIATHGNYHQPTLIKLSQQQKDHILALNKQYKPSRNDEHAWSTVIQAMQGVILNPHGTGWRFGRNPPFSVAAKTGTVQVHGHCTAESVLNNASLPENLRCNQMFIAFAPVKKPSIALAVVIEHGGSASAIARQVMDAYFKINNGIKHD